MINEDQIPVARKASLKLALHGGEDYELLFTAGPSSKVPEAIEGVRVTEIGTIHRRSDNRPQMQILGQNGALKPLKPLGWQHFSGGKHGLNLRLKRLFCRETFPTLLRRMVYEHTFVSNTEHAC